MNQEVSSFIKKGYGTFPYFIIRISSGIFRQIPIHFRWADLLIYEGVYVPVAESDTIETVIEHCQQVLWRLLRNKPVEYSGGAGSDALKLHKTNGLNGCVVLAPNWAIYLNPVEQSVLDHKSIPAGGALLSLDNSQMEFPNEQHYVIR
jgi:hypothetical protein